MLLYAFCMHWTCMPIKTVYAMKGLPEMYGLFQGSVGLLKGYVIQFLESVDL